MRAPHVARARRTRALMPRAAPPRSNATAIERHDAAAALLRRGLDAFPKDVRLLARLGDALMCVAAALPDASSGR